MMYVRFPLSFRIVEDLLHERSIDISHETFRFWWNRFNPIFAAGIRKKRDKKAASRFFRKSMEPYGRPASIVTDMLRSYDSALKEIGTAITRKPAAKSGTLTPPTTAKTLT